MWIRYQIERIFEKLDAMFRSYSAHSINSSGLRRQRLALRQSHNRWALDYKLFLIHKSDPIPDPCWRCRCTGRLARVCFILNAIEFLFVTVNQRPLFTSYIRISSPLLCHDCPCVDIILLIVFMLCLTSLPVMSISFMSISNNARKGIFNTHAINRSSVITDESHFRFPSLRLITTSVDFHCLFGLHARILDLFSHRQWSFSNATPCISYI